jgi:hypothetical protein
LFLSVRGFYRLRRTEQLLATNAAAVLPSSSRNGVGILCHGLFEAQSPRPLIPLSTLQSPPHDEACKTRGQDGFAVLLSCRTLSSPTTCRFSPALSGRPVTCPEPTLYALDYSMLVPSDHLPRGTINTVKCSSGCLIPIIGEPGSPAPQDFGSVSDIKNMRCGSQRRTRLLLWTSCRPSTRIPLPSVHRSRLPL